MNYVFVILLTASTLLAQIPNPKSEVQSVPVLQEWWRADNMVYGINGMTWLENFYNGKGALVISTPNGVQTWQLRYPWDTVNVFTWQGGDANIKTGDFNGDGIIDYLDGKGNIYQGTQQGKPPVLSNKKLEYSLRHDQLRITDINKDGKSDVMVFADALYPNGLFAQVFLGNQIIDNIKPKNISRVGLIDTSSFSYCLYETEKPELRMITVYYQKGSFDGYKLYDVSLNNADTSIKLKQLHEFMVSDDKRSCGGTNALLIDNLKHTIYWVALEMINERRELTNVTIYDLTHDTFNKLYTVRMDSVGIINTLSNSIDSNPTKDFIIWKMLAEDSDTSQILCMSGDVENKLTTISAFFFHGMSGIATVADLNNDTISEIAISGKVGKYVFRIYEGINENSTNVDYSSIIKRLSLECNLVNNLQQSAISCKLANAIQGKYGVTIYDSIGKQITNTTYYEVNDKDNTLIIDISTAQLVKGVYTVLIRNSQFASSCKIIVE